MDGDGYEGAYLALRTKPHAWRHSSERRIQAAHVIN